jgi:methionyl-tRNA formyltransferase
MHVRVAPSNPPDVETPVRLPLKVGLLIDSYVQPQWVYDIIADIQRSSCARIALVVENGDVDQPERGFVRRLLKNRHRLAYALYTRLDDRLFRRQPDAWTNTSIAPLVADAERLSVTPIKKRFSDYFTPEDVARVTSHDLDVVLRLGFRILRGDALRIARFGVWSYHHGDNLVNRGGPPGFWEVMEGQPVTGTVLQILSSELDNGTVIYRSHAPTDPHSVRRNVENFYRKSAAFVMRKLEDLASRGPAALECDPHAGTYMPYTNRLYKEPGNVEMAKLALRIGRRAVAHKLRTALYHDQWALAWRVHPGTPGPDPGFNRYRTVLPPRDRFWADPFPVAHDDGFYVFVEELPYERGKGHIAVLDVDRSGALRSAQAALEGPDHLSYPFVFEWRGERYMIPETGSRRRVELYRSRAFPFDWQLESVLLDGLYAVDATIAEIDGTWWMFANVGVEGALNYDELHLFHAPAPSGPWTPHRGNPVKSDARCARPAGRLFYWHGDLYRPSQDCSGMYGSAIVINRVTRLSATEYREEAVSRIEPKWLPNLRGTHTLNSVPGFSVIDVLVRRRRLPWPRS